MLLEVDGPMTMVALALAHGLCAARAQDHEGDPSHSAGSGAEATTQYTTEEISQMFEAQTGIATVRAQAGCAHFPPFFLVLARLHRMPSRPPAASGRRSQPASWRDLLLPLASWEEGAQQT